ncbi:MAG: aspartyl protease family protein [Candidatus Eremiobacteraeota bacterium]|nr:aspartyl protease family protein [Candidatus Eremiobacteraeota bacterium]MBC5803780.1 aspartyl protease family protein [Candidatus Eremiobacteraeota bacterium]MBC5820499.1 aspartyl protease family protein [Candidatus Eremiobacteraeota bacterium]
MRAWPASPDARRGCRATLGSLLFAGIATVCALWCGHGPARADVLPSIDELFARERLASGAERRPATERETWDIRRDGLGGTLVTIHRGSDSISAMTLGPFHSARGSDRGQRWHQNDNGETVFERPDPSGNERIVARSVTRVREPVDAWLVSQAYAGGHVVRTYFDPRSYLIVRVDKSLAGRTSHTSYDDFRTDARGRTRAWHEFGGDDRPQTTFDYRLAHDELAPALAPGTFTIPGDRRSLVEFPAGSRTVRLPARIENGRIYVRLTIAGRGLDFLLDSGAAAMSIDGALARRLGLPAYGRTMETVAGSFAASRVIVPQVGIGPLAMHDVVMRTIPISMREGTKTRVVGLLGFDFLDAVALRIDYAGGSVDVARPGSGAAPAGAVPLDVRLGSQIPLTRVTVGEATGNDFIVDTGAEFSLVLFQRFTHAHPELATPLGRGVRSGAGIGGTMAYRDLVPQRLTLGPVLFEALPTVEALSPYALGFDDADGLVGSDVLRRFTVYLDYASNRGWLAYPRAPLTSVGIPARMTEPKQGRDRTLTGRLRAIRSHDKDRR